MFLASAKMSAKAIREATGKGFLNTFLKLDGVATSRFVSVTADTNWDTLAATNPWLVTEVHTFQQNED